MYNIVSGIDGFIPFECALKKKSVAAEYHFSAITRDLTCSCNAQQQGAELS